MRAAPGKGQPCAFDQGGTLRAGVREKGTDFNYTDFVSYLQLIRK